MEAAESVRVASARNARMNCAGARIPSKPGRLAAVILFPVDRRGKVVIIMAMRVVPQRLISLCLLKRDRGFLLAKWGGSSACRRRLFIGYE